MKNNKIIILDGPDFSGKSTLANEIAKQTKGHIIHASYNKNWDSISEYHRTLFKAANLMAEYQDVVIDRLCLSEYVYGTVFRGGSEYDPVEFLYQDIDWLNTNKAKLIWVYCSTTNSEELFQEGRKQREEMYSSMVEVNRVFEEIVEATDEAFHFKRYDFQTDGKNLNKYVEELLK